MKTEEELFADFINEYHSHEAMFIVSDPFLYRYWRNSSDFACYRFRRAILDLRDAIIVIFKIEIIVEVLAKILNKISGRKEK